MIVAHVLSSLHIGGGERVALELSAESARALVDAILAALASGEVEHGHAHEQGHQHERA